MKIEINNLRKIFSVQDEFNQSFPSLRIEFYDDAMRSNGSAFNQLIKNGNRTLSECRSTSNQGFIEIIKDMTLGDLKSIFKNTYGISVEFFQKSSYSNIDGNWVSDQTELEPVSKKKNNVFPTANEHD